MYKTFFIFKPDCIQRGKLNDCLSRLELNGFITEKPTIMKLDATTIKKLYYPFTIANCPMQFKKMKEQFIIEYLSSGLIAYVKVQLKTNIKIDCSIFELARKIQGLDYYPELCKPNSIRYDFRDKTRDNTWIILDYIIGFGNVAGEIVYNIVHTPANLEEFIYQSAILDNFIKIIK